MIELTKQTLYKSLGNANLTISELEEIALDIEINLKPLTSEENDTELPNPNYKLLDLWS